MDEILPLPPHGRTCLLACVTNNRIVQRTPRGQALGRLAGVLFYGQGAGRHHLLGGPARPPLGGEPSPGEETPAGSPPHRMPYPADLAPMRHHCRRLPRPGKTAHRPRSPSSGDWFGNSSCDGTKSIENRCATPVGSRRGTEPVSDPGGADVASTSDRPRRPRRVRDPT